MRGRWARLLLLLLIGYVCFTSFTYLSSQVPLVKAENQVVKVARKENLKHIKDFYLFTKDETWLTVRAENAEGREVYFTYQPDKKISHQGFVDEMVTEENALALTRYEKPEVQVKEARLGYEDKYFVWEVSFIDEDGQLGYHYINAYNAVWYETIERL